MGSFRFQINLKFKIRNLNSNWKLKIVNSLEERLYGSKSF